MGCKAGEGGSEGESDQESDVLGVKECREDGGEDEWERSGWEKMGGQDRVGR